MTLSSQQNEVLRKLLAALIDQEKACTLVPPYRTKPGFWFGGGNLVQDEAGVIWMSGRYRNEGDSRTGLAAGQRGLECAIFRSEDGGQTFEKARSWSKAEVSYDETPTVSIEGTSLHRLSDGSWELFISTEKAMSYPESVASYQKPGTGVWTIDRITGATPETLDASTLSPVLKNIGELGYLHVKDPVVFDQEDGQTVMIFCSHPFSWAAGNTGLALRACGQSDFEINAWEMVGRGACWDVAATRITSRLRIPQIGLFADEPAGAVYFYDGAECLRSHEENERAHKRSRGYSCEEIGGAFFGWEASFPDLKRLSVTGPWFVSPHGTGCSRYVETLVTPYGILSIWQQAQDDGSQPLVGRFLSMERVEGILQMGK